MQRVIRQCEEYAQYHWEPFQNKDLCGPWSQVHHGSQSQST